MKYFTSIIPVVGIAVMSLSLSLSAADTVVDDFSDLDNLNTLSGEWAYYDDGIGSGKSGRLQARPDVGVSTSKVDVNSAFGKKPDGSPDYSINVYSFEVQEVEGQQYAYMPFTFGDKWQDSTGAIEAFVGMTTPLSADSQAMDLTAMSGVKFKAKTSSNDLNVTFIIETSDIEADSMYAYYQTTKKITKDTWNDITIAIAELRQPLWTPEAAIKAFDPTKAVRLSWQISFSKNRGLGELAMDELDIDDIMFTDIPISVTKSRSSAVQAVATFTTLYRNGNFRIEGIVPGTFTRGTFRVFNAAGAVIYRYSLGNATNTLPGVFLPNGLYFVQVQGVNSKGDNVRMQSSLCITE